MNLEITFTPYYLIVFTILVCLIQPFKKADEKRKKLITYFCISILILFFGIRGSVGNDYYYYHSYYEQATSEKTLIFGPGYALINWIFKTANLSFQCMLFFFSVLTNILLMYFWKITKNNIPFVVTIFFALGGIINEIDFIRNILSLALFVNSIKYIEEERNLKKFLSLNFVGFLFHYSSIIYIPFFWIGRKVLTPQAYGSMLILGFTWGIFHVPFLNIIPQILENLKFAYLNHLCQYIELYSGITMTFSLGTIERIITGITVCTLYTKLSSTFIGRIGILSFLCLFLSYNILSGYAILATRIGNLFIYSYWILWPLFISYLSKRRTKICAYFLMFSYMLLRLLSISLLPQWQYSIY